MVQNTRDAPRSEIIPVPTGFTPEGVKVSVLNPAILALLEQAIPPNLGGRDIFIHLLYYATLSPKTTMQLGLFKETGDSSDEAIILITKVEDLARSSGSRWSPETYHKVLLVLEALGIIRRRFHRKYTEIRIPLGKREIHIPSLLKALNLLHDGYRNKKVKQIARKVAMRLQSSEFAEYQGISLPTQITPDLTPVAQILTSLLGEHGVESVNLPRLAEACTLVAQAIQSGRVADKKGEFVGQIKDGALQIGVKKGDSKAQSGEFVEADQQLEGESPASSETGSGEFVTKESPNLVNLAPDPAIDVGKTRPRRVKRGDLQAPFTMESPEFASTSSILAQLGEFNARVSIIGQSSSNIISNKEDTIIDAASETRPYEDTRDIEEIRREARLYESLFDNGRSRQWMGSLIDVIRETPPEAKRYAAVATLFYSHFPMPDGRYVYLPGGFFTDTCKRYRRPGAKIPADVRAWAETGQSLKAIKKALELGQRHPAQASLPVFSEQEAEQAEFPNGQQQELSPYEVDRASTYPEPVTYDLPGSCQSQLRTWMNQEDAGRLRDRIEREGRDYQIQARVVPGSRQGTFVVVITWGECDVDILNEAEWVQYFNDTKDLV